MRQRGKAVKAPRFDGLVHDPRRLKRRRFMAGLEQKDAARAAGITPQRLSQLELGQCGSPSPTILAKLAQAYGCEIADLMPRSRDEDDGPRAEAKAAL